LAPAWHQALPVDLGDDSVFTLALADRLTDDPVDAAPLEADRRVGPPQHGR
jgi:hypothetical protein